MWCFVIRQKVVISTVGILMFIKVIWVSWSCWNNGSFYKEKNELIQRKHYLVEKIVIEPLQLLNEMPSGIGLQFQGEWALYSCSMLTEALSNMAEIYPETREEAVTTIDSLIQIVKSPEIRLYDKLRWGEDPLESLDGDESHVSYLSHLAWMIGNYKRSGGNRKYDRLYDSLCETMNRSIVNSPLYNLPTYPDEPVYVPDMLVAIVALSDYSKQHNGKYSNTVNKWLERAKTEWIDEYSDITNAPPQLVPSLCLCLFIE